MSHSPLFLNESTRAFWLHLLLRSAEQSRNSFFSLLFPWRCCGCKILLPYPDVICESCAGLLRKILSPFCQRCGDPFPSFWEVSICSNCRLGKLGLTRVCSLYYYEDLVKFMIREAKFAKKARILSFFADQMYVRARSEFPASVQAIVPVPMHKSKEWERTFNQAERIAILISRYWGIPLWKALRKSGQTLPQSSLSESARRRNLKGAFVWNSIKSVPRSVLLVDDVLTTGATLRECARVLRKAGVRRVYGITIARAVKLF